MDSKEIDLMIDSIKRQNEYDYKIQEDKERIKNNIKEYKNKMNQQKRIKNEMFQKRKEEVNKINLIKRANKINEINSHINNINPSESIKFNNKPLIPITKDSIYNYINNFNFDRYKILKENEENRLNLSKSVNYKLKHYSNNKKIYMDNIKNNFSEKNLESKEKTKKIFENFKKSNIDLRNKINLEKAKKFHNFLNYLQKKEYDNEIYNDKLINKQLLAKEKYDNYFKKKEELVIKRVRDLRYGKIEDDFSDSYKIFNTINTNIKRGKDIKIVKKLVNKDVKKMQKMHDDNVVKLNIEKEKYIKDILDNQNKYFTKSNNKIKDMNDNKTISILNKLNNNINLENKLKEAKNKYERNLKSEIIYKKGQF